MNHKHLQDACPTLSLICRRFPHVKGMWCLGSGSTETCKFGSRPQAGHYQVWKAIHKQSSKEQPDYCSYKRIIFCVRHHFLMDMLISLIVVIISQCVLISKYTVHLKYIQFNVIFICQVCLNKGGG